MTKYSEQYSDPSKFESPEKHIDLLDSAETILRNHEETSRIKEEDFIDMYGKEEVLKDKSTINRLEKKFAEETKELGEEEEERRKIVSAMENVIAVYGNEFGWFGNADIKRASKYDDYHNGIDEIIEYDFSDKEDNTEKQYMGLAVDAILSSSYSGIKEKVENNLRCIFDENQRGKEVKYYENEDGEKMKLEHVIPVVVGLDGQDSKRMFDQVGMYLDAKTRREKYPGSGSDFEYENAVGKMLDNPAQKVFLEQISVQLEFYLKKLEREKNRENVVDFYNKIESMKDVVDEVLFEDKKDKPDIWSDDKVLLQLKKVLNTDIREKI